MLAFLSFFEELEVDEQPTEEAQPRRRPRMPRRPGSGGGGGRSGGGRTPGLQRLLILAGVVLLVAVVAIWQIRSCQRDQEVKSYKDFVSDSNTIAKVGMQNGMRSLRQDGARQVLNGNTAVEEVLAATQAGDLE